MSLSKRILAAALSLLLVLPAMAPALAEGETPSTGEGEVDNTTEKNMEDARRALQRVVNRGISAKYYTEASRADFNAAKAAAEVVLETTKDQVSKVALQSIKDAQSNLEASKASLVLTDEAKAAHIAGTFSFDNTAYDTTSATSPWGEIQVDWTAADKTPIDLSKADPTKVTISFTVTLTNDSEGAVSDEEVFGPAQLVLRSHVDGVEKKGQYALTGLKAGENKISLKLSELKDNEIELANLSQMRLFINGVTAKDPEKKGWFTLKVEDTVIVDETPTDYVKPLAAFTDGSTINYQEGRNDLTTTWLKTQPFSVKGMDLTKTYLLVNFDLAKADGVELPADLFKTGSICLRSDDTAVLDAEGNPVIDEDTGTAKKQENNIRASFGTLIEKGDFTPDIGSNTLKIALADFQNKTGELDYAAINQFRMYFDGLSQHGLNTGDISLKLNSATIVADDDAVLDEGVLGLFPTSGTITPTTDNLLNYDWSKSSELINVADPANTYLHLVLNLTGDGEFKAGNVVLRSQPGDASDPIGTENNVTYDIGKMIDQGIISVMGEGKNELMIPVTAFTASKGNIDWSAVEALRVFLSNVPSDSTMVVSKAELKYEKADPTIVGSFPKAAGTYAPVNGVLQTNWTDAKMPFSIKDASDEAFLRIRFSLTNGTDMADADVFKTGKVLLASTNTPTDADTVGENSVRVQIADVLNKMGATVSSEGENVWEIPLSAFAEEKGTFNAEDVAKFRMFIDSTQGLEGDLSMTIEEVTVVDPAKQELEVESLAVKTAPTKTVYKQGEKLDLTGLVLTATLSDGNTVDVDASKVTASGYVATKVGKQTVTLTYGGKTTTIEVTVEERTDLQLGDANGDGSVDSMDALAVLQHEAGLQLLTGANLNAADVDGVTGVDSMDALAILQKEAGIIDHFVVEQ